MRQKRAKTYKKLMALYSRSFGFRQPYQVLLDSTFCIELFQHKVDALKQLGMVLQGDCKLMITQCSMVDLYKLGASGQAIVDMAKQYERRRCNHREAIENEACVESVVGETNKHRYVIATQSTELRNGLRKIAGVPIVHMNRSIMVLEPCSEATTKAKEQADAMAMGMREPESKALASTSIPTPIEQIHRRKVAKGPNPLSVKKKSAPVDPSTKTAESKAEASGGKRARDEDPGSGNGIDTEENKGGDGHKRKRRRKHGTPSAV